MIPSIYIVHVAMKLTHEQQAQQQCACGQNCGSVDGDPPQNVDHVGVKMHRLTHGQPVDIILDSSAVSILDCTSMLGSTLYWPRVVRGIDTEKAGNGWGHQH